MATREEKPTACSFCGKTAKEVEKLFIPWEDSCIAVQFRAGSKEDPRLLLATETTLPASAICDQCVARLDALLQQAYEIDVRTAPAYEESRKHSVCTRELAEVDACLRAPGCEDPYACVRIAADPAAKREELQAEFREYLARHGDASQTFRDALAKLERADGEPPQE